MIVTCSTCGSSDVLIDAYVHANDPQDVRTFDEMVCNACGERGSSLRFTRTPDTRAGEQAPTPDRTGTTDPVAPDLMTPDLLTPHERG